MWGNLTGPLTFITGGESFTSVGSVVSAVANVFLFIAFGLSFVSLAFSFIQIVTSAGDIKNLEKAKRSLLWSVIGMLISLSAYALVSILYQLIG